MKSLRFIIITVLCASALQAGATTVTFTDNFKGVEVQLPGKGTKLYPDPKNWAYTFWPGIVYPTSYGDGTNWLAGNGESQTYVTPFLTTIGKSTIPANLRYDPFSIQSDGLNIKAALLSTAQQKAYQIGSYRRFGSGMILSRFAFTYGHIRVVAKMPNALGTWPAIWLLAQNHIWPPEIDILEAMPWKQHAEQIHDGILVPTGQTGTFGAWNDVGVDVSKAFHTYGLDWTPDTLTGTFDGKTMWQVPTPDSMKQDMYLIINLAVGGIWVDNELGISPIDGKSDSRLTEGSNMIQGDYPTHMVIKSVTITPLE